MENHSKKRDKISKWKQNNQCFYDFIHQNYVDWPVSTMQWGQLLQQGQEFVQQRLYFACKTDGIYNGSDRTWQNTPNYIIFASVQLPNPNHYFINELHTLFNQEAAKKHPYLKVKQILNHPGQATVIRTSPINRKLLASKSDNNQVYVWQSDRFKVNSTQFANHPDIVLNNKLSQRANYAIRFAPSLPKLLTASDDRLQLFDVQISTSKRDVSPNEFNAICILQGHQKVQDLSFKNNQICATGGQDKQIGIWDLRIGTLCHKIKNIHDNDINNVAYRDNCILSGGQEGILNIIDDRNYKIIYQFQSEHSQHNERIIHSIQFDSISSHFGIGRNELSLYSLDKVFKTGQLKPIFTHHGLKGNITEFDWNSQSHMTLASTFQDVDMDVNAQGGIIHVFRPLDLFYADKQDNLNEIRKAYTQLTNQEKQQLKDYVGWTDL